MFDLQQYGQPPASIIKDLAPGLKFDENGAYLIYAICILLAYYLPSACILLQYYFLKIPYIANFSIVTISFTIIITITITITIHVL